MSRRGRVRIIAGRWRRRLLEVPERPGLRPTPDRVRETLFNWLAPGIEGAACLDAFAGSGALGFEAASRGARRVVLLERDAALARNLARVAAALGADTVAVECADALAWIERASERFDVVFLDPPFATVDLVQIMSRLQVNGLLSPGALVYVERGAGDDGALAPPGWSVPRAQRAGQVRYYLASPDPPEPDVDPRDSKPR